MFELRKQAVRGMSRSETLAEALAWVDSGPTVVGAKHVIALAEVVRSFIGAEVIWWCDVHKQKATGWPHGVHTSPTSCPHWWRHKDCVMVSKRLV